MIIAISGKKQSGKDTTGKLINIILSNPHLNVDGVLKFLEKDIGQTYFTTKKFADSLKDTVCLWLGCTREQLEDEVFKNTPLEKEWDKWIIINRNISTPSNFYGLFTSKEEAEQCPQMKSNTKFSTKYEVKKIKLTPRLLMQLLGTECGRNIIHPNIWTNIMFKDYNSDNAFNIDLYMTKLRRKSFSHLSWLSQKQIEELSLPNWIITDLRFLNELEECKKRNAILIRVNRLIHKDSNNTYHVYNPLFDDKHISETALDNYNDWDYIINNGSLEDLYKQVKEILVKENIFKL